MNDARIAPAPGAPAGAQPGSLRSALDAQGHALLPGLLDEATCARVIALYEDEARFRSRIDMSRHGFGRGHYRYFDYPLPPDIQRLRERLYPALAEVANDWNAMRRKTRHYPATLDGWLAECHDAGQHRATPLMLRYGPGDYNCLHQDLYGEHVFPLQLAVLLSRPGEDFSGGEFVLTQSAADQRHACVVPLTRGDAVVFPVRDRPALHAGPRGRRTLRSIQMRHGVSEVRTGRRDVLGIIFHDAA